MKGLAFFAIPIMGLIFLGTIVVMILMPVFALKIHIIKQVDIEYKYNNAQFVVLTLLSSTNEKKAISETVAEHIALQDKPNTDFLKTILDQQIESKCYVLYSIDTQKNLVKTCDNPGQYIADKIKIPLPYKPLEKESLPTCASATNRLLCDEANIGRRSSGSAEATQNLKYWLCTKACSSTGSVEEVGCIIGIKGLSLEGFTCCPVEPTGKWNEDKSGKYGEWLEKCPGEQESTINKNLVSSIRMVMN